MALHDSLRDLVSVRGAGVADEAEELRGALDDFLAEDEATLGEMNLLVDAVRLGALRRALDVMHHGAEPEAAVREAGAALARDRGTDDPTRSCWAIAALCFALGKVDESLVRTFRADAGTMPAPAPPTGPHGRAPEPVADGTPGPETPVSTTGGVPATPVLDDPPVPVESQPVPQPPPPPPPPPSPTVEVQPVGTGYRRAAAPPVIPQQGPSRAGTFLLVILVALILGGLVAAGVILLRSGADDDPTASDDPSDSVGDTGPKEERPLVAEDEMLVPYSDGDTSIIYAVDVDGGFRALTNGPLDILPTLSPDRRTMTFEEGPAPLSLIRWDLETSSFEPFFDDPGACVHALRPGWSLDGRQVALACTGDDVLPDGIWLAPSDGNGAPEPIVTDSLVRGSPTWVSPTRIVYGHQESASKDAPLTFWTVDVDERVPEPLDVTMPGMQVTHADWSPNAQKLLFLVSPQGEDEIGSVWTMDADGSNAEVLAEGSFAHPVWSPDGRSIGVTTVLDDGTQALAYIDVDDPDAPDVTPTVVPDPPPGKVGVPVWGTR